MRTKNTCGPAESIGEIKTLVGLLIAFAKINIIAAQLIAFAKSNTCGPADSVCEIRSIHG